ncbi:hypothetical protein RJ639_047456 [Escallonia herrerae]|uniref:Fe2OG dioxygenase domain-containing protein n=1 Tax=Escallonia herrerae TaxID=1293975 RepID=A0AA88W603_9ASTE|nr:hypothetical protein RJ639_047456 [Escallonia herrerae]
MDPQEQLKLPVIDFTATNLSRGTSSWQSTSNEVRSALENYGCFIAKYNKISLELHNSVFDQSKELFDLPMEIKVRNTSNLLGFGYGGNFSFMPLVEYFGIENGATQDATQHFTNLMWPAGGHDNFSATVLMYAKLLSEFDHEVMKMVFESYGVDQMYCDALIQSSMYLMRFLKYQGPGVDDPNNIGLRPHIDKNFLAIIDTNQVKGLEIETRNGEWIGFEPSPSTYVVIAGEPFMAWSNGRVYAPLHRVAMRGTEVKYSVGLFSFMRKIIEVPEELVDEQHPLQFKPFNHLEFLQYCGEGGKKFKNPINAYCGI